MSIQKEDLVDRYSLVKSQSDDRVYRGIIIKANKLKVVLISDPKTEKSSASLTVGTGSLADPEDFQGLAHFLEHMLFLGTEKYPVENEFDKFLNENGGESNAYTVSDHTNYHYDVSPEALEQSLDRFAYFFINPLLSPDATEREIEAVNSEHEQYVSNDSWRSEELDHCTSTPSHPYHRFFTGNIDTLWHRPREKNLDIIKALHEYHSSYYSANIMNLVVLGRESLDDLEKIVVPLFAQIKNKNVELQHWNESPFGNEVVGVLIRAVPIKDLRQLVMTFPVPDVTPSYKCGSDNYLTHLLGHEGKGSLLSFLKKKNWATELTADISPLGRGFSTASIEIELSNTGLANVNDVALTVFQYLEMLRRENVQEWIWNELKEIEAMKFRFKDQKRPESAACDLSPNMLIYPLEDVLSAEYLLFDFNPQQIVDLLTYLVPDKCRLTIFSKENKDHVNKVEEFYKIEYSIEKVQENVMEKWKTCGLNEDLHLPFQNEFIPSNFELKQPRQNWGIIPRCILDCGLNRVFFLQDNEYLLPKGTIRVEISNPKLFNSARVQALNGLFRRTVEDGLAELSYNATVAGMDYSLVETTHGLWVYVSGYHDKIGILLERVLEGIVWFKAEAERFQVIKERYSRKLKNWEQEQPNKHAIWYINYLLRERKWTHTEILNELQDLTWDDVVQFSKDFIKHLKLTWLVYGNFIDKEALELTLKCSELFTNAGTQSLGVNEEFLLKELKLMPGSDYLFSRCQNTHTDSCAMVLFQAHPEEAKSNVLIELIDSIAYEKSYNQLRTKEQLGYLVWTSVRRGGGARGMEILVQSGYDASYVESRIDAFLESFYETLKSMTDEEFNQHKESLRTRKSEKPKSLNGRSDRLWNEITSRHLMFNRVQEELQAIDGLLLKDMLNYFQEIVGPDHSKRRRLTIHVCSNCEKKKRKKRSQPEECTPAKIFQRNPCPIDNIPDWRGSQDWFNAYSFPTNLKSENNAEEIQ